MNQLNKNVFVLTSFEIYQSAPTGNALVKVLKRNIKIHGEGVKKYYKQEGETMCEVNYGGIVVHPNFGPTLKEEL